MTGDMPGAVIRQRVRAVLFVVILLLLVGLILVFRDQIVVAFVEHHRVLLLVAGIVVVSLGLQAYNFLQLLKVQGRVSVLRAWHTWATANLVNYLGPFQPGLAVRAAYFRSFGVPVIDTTRATLRQLLLSLWIGSGMTVVGLFHADAAVRLFAVCGSLLFMLAPLVAAGLRTVVPAGPGTSRMSGMARSLLGLCRLDMPVYRLWPFVMQYVLMALVFYFAYNEFGIHLGPVESILLAVIFAASALIAVAPNNLGVQEALLGFVAYQGGLGSGEALGVALVFRVAHLLACAFVLLVTGRE